MFVNSGRAELAHEITGFSDGADVLLIHAGVTDRRSPESDPTTLEEIAKFVDAQRAGYRNSPTGMSHQ
jgi:hypothetical protein